MPFSSAMPAATVSQRTQCRDLNGAHWNLFILSSRNIPAESQSTNNWTVALLLIQWILFYRAVETETLTGQIVSSRTTGLSRSGLLVTEDHLQSYMTDSIFDSLHYLSQSGKHTIYLMRRIRN
nr:hypothetical protein CFP56_25543 [Quercus suber]